MKCPKCNAENKENSKFCIKCGANIAEELAKVNKEAAKVEKVTSEKETKKEEESKKKKEKEDKKKLAEIRKKEKEKLEEKIKEAEKAEAIRQAKQEGIELEIIDREPEKNIEQPTEQKKFTKKENNKEKNKKVKKKKVVIKKNIFQRIFNKLLFMIIIAAIIIGAVYYCYTQKLLPEFIQKEVEDFDYKLQNVINNYKEVEAKKANTEEINNNEEWIIDPTVEADDIKDLNQEVSAIVKDGKYGIINNTTSEILLEPKYTNIYYGEYYDIDKTEEEKTEGIIVKDIEKFYKVDSSYKISTEINVLPEETKNTYFYDHHGENVYETTATGETTKFKTNNSKELEVCTDIDLVTTDDNAARNVDLPEKFVIDFDKSTVTTKGYFDTSTGELIINCDYDEAYEFVGRYAAVKFENKAGIIDKEGNEVVELKYQETRSVHNGTAFVKKDGKWGILKIK